MNNDWNPAQYLKFADQRTRPARDLLAQVPLDKPCRAYDLGCGPGNSTQVLCDHFPQAEVIGIDNSPAMLKAARAACPSAHFAAGDLASWSPDLRPDLLFSNATFQWLPGHVAVLQRLLGGLTLGAVLAVQMPDNLDEPSHALMRQVAGQGPWAAKLVEASGARAALLSPSGYYDALKPHAAKLDIWHSIYNHALDGIEGIIAWLMSTGLRPFLDPLDETEKADFLAAYQAELAKAYPPAQDGKVLLRFPRLFMVAVR